MNFLEDWMKLIRGLVLAVLSAACSNAFAQPGHSQDDLRSTITQFEEALQKRNLSQIEKLVAPDIVVFENGMRNNGWPDFRDHHLIPEFREPAAVTRTEFVRSETSGKMAWAYTHSELSTEKDGKLIKLMLWSVYVLQRDAQRWKIHVINWSVGRAPYQ